MKKIGRPTKDYKRVTFSLSSRHIGYLTSLAQMRGCSMTKVLEQAIDDQVNPKRLLEIAKEI